MPFSGSAAILGTSRFAAATGSVEEFVTVAAGASQTTRELRLVGMAGFTFVIVQTAGPALAGSWQLEVAKSSTFYRADQGNIAPAVLGDALIFPTTSGRYHITGRAAQLRVTGGQVAGNYTYLVRFSASS